ncbi:hypothetical protein E2562_034444 [Oryza meyeriana var. granulata]|uniref:Uncharacterized protein n=1 Tax=Oryza meyeriana var. granulata TaxID=110450 RepID=A0A6G1FFC1_9ORYZ|nr:hypothetical protein E2562_034444 [Oryza meyeriana var. granulata]
MCRSRSKALLALLLICAAAGKGNKGGVGRVEVEYSDLATGPSAWQAAAGASATGAEARRSMTCASVPPRPGGYRTKSSLAIRPPPAPPTPSDNDAPTAATAVVLLAINLLYSFPSVLLDLRI